MFFKRRSRANSYIDSDDAPPKRSQSYDTYENRTDSARDSHPVASPTEEKEIMYPRPQQPQEAYQPRGIPNGAGHNAAMAAAMNATPPMSSGKMEPMPDLLTQAFQSAVRPYLEKIEQLEGQMQDLQQWVEQLEAQRAEVHNWIDKRGLRPDVPPSIAKIMDSSNPGEAAITLNAQLDRKITIVNFDLHRLQDDLNDSISSAHFASAMLKFIPDINRLSQLPTGSRFAFDLILKLGGNLNSHGGLENGEPDDLHARRDFYNRLDNTMVEVVRRRFAEGEEWNVQREIKRIEKTASYLRNYGVEPYFPQTLALMSQEMGYTSREGSRGGMPPANPNSMNGGGTPPRYH